MFATDRDLLALEPTLFRDVGWAGQTLITGYANIEDTTLALENFDLDFEQAHIAAGHIIEVDGALYEVVERLSATTLTISRLRASTADPLQPPSPTTNKLAHIRTFAPQIAIIHRQILAMLGLAAAGQPGLTESAVVNPCDLAHLESLGALHLIFAAIAEPDTRTTSNLASHRAAMYRQRFAAERERAAAYIDTNGDSLPDAIRRPTTIHLLR